MIKEEKRYKNMEELFHFVTALATFFERMGHPDIAEFICKFLVDYIGEEKMAELEAEMEVDTKNRVQ
jgi:hypothetical protein